MRRDGSRYNIMAQAFLKDPDSVLDYHINWDSWLNGDTISTSSWTADAGIVIDSDSNTSTAATVWLSSGTAANEYTVTNQIVTAGSRTDDRSIYILVNEK